MIRKGSVDAIRRHVEATVVTSLPMLIKKSIRLRVREHAAGGGGRFSCAGRYCAERYVKGGIKERFAQLRKMGIKTG